MMNIEQFRATRTTMTRDDFCKLSSIDRAAILAPMVLAYDGTLYIEDYGPGNRHPETGEPMGRYYLLLERYDWASDDLADLEQRLYDWAAGEHFLNP